MDNEECYRWGDLFALDWDALVTGMSARAEAMSLVQEERNGVLLWNRESAEHCRWVFVDDPTDVENIRAVYANEGNARSPSCFVVVKQPDPSDDRGDIIFDIFRMSPQSYLWHFNRVYTRPSRKEK
jgi:hypothetical protein